MLAILSVFLSFVAAEWHHKLQANPRGFSVGAGGGPYLSASPPELYKPREDFSLLFFPNDDTKPGHNAIGN